MAQYRKDAKTLDEKQKYKFKIKVNMIEGQFNHFKYQKTVANFSN